jgi:hypothetical protein
MNLTAVCGRGEYVAKIHGETKGRPRTVERHTDARRSHNSEMNQLTCLIFPMYVVRSRARQDPSLILKLYLLSALMTPFFLPKLHERFFWD